MKEASGELNMTLVTIIAVAAVLGIFWLLKDPIVETINGLWGQTAQDYEATGTK